MSYFNVLEFPINVLEISHWCPRMFPISVLEFPINVIEFSKQSPRVSPLVSSKFPINVLELPNNALLFPMIALEVPQ